MIRKILILTPMILGLSTLGNFAISAENYNKATETGPTVITPSTNEVTPTTTERSETKKLKSSEAANPQILKDVRLITESVEHLNNSLSTQSTIPDATKTQLQNYEAAIRLESRAIHSDNKENESSTRFNEFVTKTDSFLELASTLTLSDIDASVLKATETLLTNIKSETKLGEPKSHHWYSHLLGKSQSSMHEQSQSELTPTEARLILQGATTIK